MKTILEILNNDLLSIFETLNYDTKLGFFQYSDRPDLSDFQTNCAMALAKILKKSPVEVAKLIVNELQKLAYVKNISIDGPGFINIILNDDILLNILNNQISTDKCTYKNKNQKRKVLVDFGGPNVAKEMHVGHLRSTVIGESIRRIYEFSGDEVISDVHYGDWGSNMGTVIETIKFLYPKLQCFQKDFNANEITDFSITATELTEIYRIGATKSKEDKEFHEKTREATKLLQDGYKPYRTLWKHFSTVSLNDTKEIFNTFGAHFDLYNGESDVHDLSLKMLEDLEKQGKLTISEGAKIIDLSEHNMIPLIVEKSDGASMYSTTDLATILDRKQQFHPDLMLYVVDGRQSDYFKQIFIASKKIGFLDEKFQAEHCPFGTMNGKDGKPFKTRSGDIVKLRFLIEEVIEKIKEKAKIQDAEVIQNIAIACIKFADLLNFREADYVFDLDKFTSFEGKTGAYLLYGLVRINSILNSNEKIAYEITQINTKEEKDLLIHLTKFNDIIETAYNKKAPNFIADYVYNLIKLFSTFYANCSINYEINIPYKNSKLSLIFLIKKQIELCLFLLGINSVEKM